MFVITAMSGGAIRVRAAISPGAFMPISRTAARWAFSSLSRDRASPRWLLKFFSDFRTGNAAERNAAANSLAVVLPTLPVIATIVTGWSRRTLRARS